MRHSHDLRPVAVSVETFYSGTKTTVLFRCDCGCGKFHSHTINGRWTLAQIAGTES